MKVEFSIKDRVKIIPLESIGRVLAVYISETGIQYSVRYFYNGEAKTVYFFRDELEAITQIK